MQKQYHEKQHLPDRRERSTGKGKKRKITASGQRRALSAVAKDSFTARGDSDRLMSYEPCCWGSASPNQSGPSFNWVAGPVKFYPPSRRFVKNRAKMAPADDLV